MTVKRFFSPLLVALALVLLLLDSTVWRWLGALGRLLARLRFFAWLEDVIARLSPGWVVAVFVVPFVPLIPIIKLGEFWLLAHHHYITAVLVIIGSKVLGAAFATRIFAIAKPKMLQVRWFAAVYGWATALLALGHAALEAVPAWRTARATMHRVKSASRRAYRRLRFRVKAMMPAGRVGRRLAAARRLAARRVASHQPSPLPR